MRSSARARISGHWSEADPNAYFAMAATAGRSRWCRASMSIGGCGGSSRSASCCRLTNQNQLPANPAWVTRPVLRPSQESISTGYAYARSPCFYPRVLLVQEAAGLLIRVLGSLVFLLLEGADASIIWRSQWALKQPFVVHHTRTGWLCDGRPHLHGLSKGRI